MIQFISERIENIVETGENLVTCILSFLQNVFKRILIRLLNSGLRCKKLIQSYNIIQRLSLFKASKAHYTKLALYNISVNNLVKQVLALKTSFTNSLTLSFD